MARHTCADGIRGASAVPSRAATISAVGDRLPAPAVDGPGGQVPRAGLALLLVERDERVRRRQLLELVAGERARAGITRSRP